MTAKKDKKSQVVLVAIFALILVLGSGGATLYVTGNVEGVAGLFGSGYKNVTLTDAYVICEGKAKDEFDERLKSLSMDDHSSRFDARSKRFKIFMEAEVYTGSGRGARADEYFINCFVRNDNGAVSTFNYAKDEVITKGSEGGGNPFGFPR